MQPKQKICVYIYEISHKMVKKFMEDKKLINQLKKNNEEALKNIIEKYNGYVCTIISNQLGFNSTELTEELACDTFFSLWQNKNKISTYHLRGYIAMIARNNAKSYLRKTKNIPISFDENYMFNVEDNTHKILEKKEQKKLIKKALSKMDKIDKEIFIRYYYYNQKTKQIGADMCLNQQTIKSRLMRGRKKLKDILERGGYKCY